MNKKRPYPPFINIDGVDASEKGIAWEISTLLLKLRSEVEEFEAAVRLLDFCEIEQMTGRQDRASAGPIPHDCDARTEWKHQIVESHEQACLISRWMRIGARDAAIRIWDFREILDSVVSYFRAVPRLCRMINLEALERAVSIFDQKLFPKAKVLRHSVAHRSQLAAKASENGTNRPYKSSGISIAKGAKNIFLDVLNGRTLVMTRRKEIIECDISWASVDKLDQALQHIFDAIKPAEEASLLAAQEWLESQANRQNK